MKRGPRPGHAAKGGNTYETCPGTGNRASEITLHAASPGPGRVGSDGEGKCPVCGRVVSQRGGTIKRHKGAS